MNDVLRPELGNFSSIVCFKAVITGMEAALGDKATAIALTSAGRARGKNLVESLGLNGVDLPLADLASKMAYALGKDGTRLLIIDKIEKEGETYKAYTRETVCSSGEDQGSDRKCTFTLGAVQGALETITGQRFRGKHVESVLRGGEHDVFEYTPLG